MKTKKLASKEEWSYLELSKFLFHCKYQRKVFLAEGETRLKIPEWGAKKQSGGWGSWNRDWGEEKQAVKSDNAFFLQIERTLVFFFWLIWNAITVLRRGMTKSALHFTRLDLIALLGSVFQVNGGNKRFIQDLKGRRVRCGQILDTWMKRRVVRIFCQLKVGALYPLLTSNLQNR